MKFGSKGLDAPVIIGIVLAVVAAAIILYILWSRGMLPFISGANEAECTAYYIRGCQSGQKFSDTVKNLACQGFGNKFKGYDMCFPGLGGGTVSCDEFCSTILSTP